jgi:outer membrane protein assembly factor BamB
VLGLSPDGSQLWDTPVGKHMNDDVESFEGALVVLPGSLGGVETPNAVAEGIVYVTVVNAAATYSSPEQNSTGFGVALGSNNSQLVAIDAATGAIVWDVPIPGDCFGAATVVNDLVFTSVLTGKIFAFDRATGEQVWSYQAPGGINGWPAVVDDRLVIPVGFGSPPVLLTLALEAE